MTNDNPDKEMTPLTPEQQKRQEELFERAKEISAALNLLLKNNPKSSVFYALNLLTVGMVQSAAGDASMLAWMHTYVADLHDELHRIMAATADAAANDAQGAAPPPEKPPLH